MNNVSFFLCLIVRSQNAALSDRSLCAYCRIAFGCQKNITGFSNNLYVTFFWQRSELTMSKANDLTADLSSFVAFSSFLEIILI